MYEIPTEQRTIYLRGLLQSYGTVSLPLGAGLSFSLPQVFQPLRLHQSAADEKKHANRDTQRDTQKDDREHDEAEEPEKVLDVLAENGIVALNKSSRGRMVAWNCPGWSFLTKDSSQRQL